MLSKKMLDALVCPLCKGTLIYNSAEKTLICSLDRLVFPIQGDIPVLLKEEAHSLDL